MRVPGRGQQGAIQDVADTARWVALYRARESEREDAHVRDPYARRLAGAAGERILKSLPRSMRNAAWSVVARTVVIDQLIQDQVAAGVTLVLNLAAGMDTRPYRLPLPAGLLWIEVDQAALLAEKSAVLADAIPRCKLERIPVDLTREPERRRLLAGVTERGGKALVITEGLLMYLEADHVAGLARDLHRTPTITGWITDLISPGLLRMIEKDWGHTLRDGNAPMRFAPMDGAAYFEGLGWRTAECRSTFTVARELGRLPWLLRLLAHLPGSARYHPERPWAGTFLLRRATGSAPR